MSDRLILTMNGGGDWIPPNVQASHQNAAARWKADYLQIIDVPTDEHFRIKHDACCNTSNYERVLWVDGDVLIREDCPDPFCEVPADKFGAVENAQIDPDRQHYIQKFYWDELCKVWKVGEYGRRAYVNGGVYVFSPVHHYAVFSSVFSALKAFDIAEAMIEQTLLNMALQMTNSGLHVLPREFNMLGPDVWNATEAPAYMTHFAHYGEECKGDRRMDVMASMEWRTAAVV